MRKCMSFLLVCVFFQEKGETVDPTFSLTVFESGYRNFMKQYKPWLLSMELEPQVHPWAKFQQPVPSAERMLDAELS